VLLKKSLPTNEKKRHAGKTRPVKKQLTRDDDNEQRMLHQLSIADRAKSAVDSKGRRLIRLFAIID